MTWTVQFLDEARKDFKRLGGSQRIVVMKAIEKTSKNPLPIYEGGYGKPLGVKYGIDLKGLYKIKLKKSGIRIIYQLVKRNKEMFIIIVGLRADEYVYKKARSRIDQGE